MPGPSTHSNSRARNSVVAATAALGALCVGALTLGKSESNSDLRNGSDQPGATAGVDPSQQSAGNSSLTQNGQVESLAERVEVMSPELRKPIALETQVLDTDGSPFSDESPILEFVNDKSPENAYRAIADHEGRVQVGELVPPGRYNVGIVNSSSFRLVASLPSATEPDQDGRPVPAQLFAQSLDPSHWVTGTVLNGPSGQPVEGLSIGLGGTPQAHLIPDAVTDEMGHFEFYAATSLQRELAGRELTFHTTDLRGLRPFDSSRDVLLGTSNHLLSLQLGTHVYFDVYDAEQGTPVSEVKFSLSEDPNYGMYQSKAAKFRVPKTSSNPLETEVLGSGRFRVGVSEEGRYRLTVAADGFQQSATISFHKRDVNTSFSIGLTPERIRDVAGTVVDESGNPVSGVVVYSLTPSSNEQQITPRTGSLPPKLRVESMWPNVANFHARAVSDNDGNIVFENVPYGPKAIGGKQVWFTSPGTGCEPFSVAENITEDNRVMIRVRRGGALEVTLEPANTSLEALQEYTNKEVNRWGPQDPLSSEFPGNLRQQFGAGIVLRSLRTGEHYPADAGMDNEPFIMIPFDGSGKVNVQGIPFGQWDILLRVVEAGPDFQLPDGRTISGGAMDAHDLLTLGRATISPDKIEKLTFDLSALASRSDVAVNIELQDPTLLQRYRVDFALVRVRQENGIWKREGYPSFPLLRKGSYHIANEVPYGSYRGLLELRKPGDFTGTQYLLSENVIHVSETAMPSNPEPLRFPERHSGTLQFRNSDGTPLSNMVVAISGSEGGVIEVATNDQGQVELMNTPRGELRFQILNPDWDADKKDPHVSRRDWQGARYLDKSFPVLSAQQLLDANGVTTIQQQ